MRIGMRESQVIQMVDEALAVAGLTERWALVLFGGASCACVAPHRLDLTLGPKRTPHSPMARELTVSWVPRI